MAALRWGLLSTGRVNDRILPAAAESDRAEVVAVASRDGARADAYAGARKIPRAHAGYERLLADDEVDAVYVSLPNHLHVEWTIRALEAGKHVLCEKPLTRKPADAERAFAVAEERGLVLSEAFMWRHLPQTRRLQELLTDGAIGEVRRVRAVFGFDLLGGLRTGPSGALRRLLGRGVEVRLVPAYDGGALMDVGCYCVSAARMVAGEPSRVEVTQVEVAHGVDVHLAARLELPGHVEAEIECGLEMPVMDELEIIGSKGSLFLDDPFFGRDPTIELHRAGEEREERIRLEPVDPYRLELENVADAVEGVEPLLLGREESVAQARALEALLRSIEERGPVELAPEGAR